jgi:hypothetical protein
MFEPLTENELIALSYATDRAAKAAYPLAAESVPGSGERYLYLDLCSLDRDLTEEALSRYESKPAVA